MTFAQLFGDKPPKDSLAHILWAAQLHGWNAAVKQCAFEIEVANRAKTRIVKDYPKILRSLEVE